jgi:FHA domain-containing protein
MILTLLAVSLNDKPLTQPITARFDGAGGSIGRADHNTLALPDPERFISRLQAEVVATGDGYIIRNMGMANPIHVGGRAVAGGETARLQHGDHIRIAGYLLEVDCQAQDRGAEDESTVSARLRAARMMAALPDVPTAPPAPAPPPLPAAAVSGLASTNPFAGLLGPSARTQADPFADLLGPPSSSLATSPPAMPGASPRRPPPTPLPTPLPPQMLPTPAGVDPRSAAFATAAASPANLLPADFDPFGTPPTAPPRAAAAPVDPFADLMPANAVPSIDSAFGLAEGPSRSADPLADFMADLGAPAKPGQRGLSTDPLALFGNEAAAPQAPAASAAPVQPDHLSALNAAYQPPKLVPPLPAPTPAPSPSVVTPQAAPNIGDDAAAAASTPEPAPPTSHPSHPSPQRPRPAPSAPRPATATTPALAAGPGTEAAPAQTSTQDAQALWAAFCEGAGVDLPLPPGTGPQRMRHIGMVLRSAVEGTLQLTAVRASTRHELRAAVTMIQQRSNNPLKFSPDAVAGVEALVQPPMRGFLDGPAAMEDSMNDLVGHSIGTVAGMRAAIEGMLDRFDPAALEAKLTGGSVIDTLLPINRRAKLWDLYLQHHLAIREEAQEDFQNLFGKAFLAAYEQQIQRLKANKAKP